MGKPTCATELRSELDRSLPLNFACIITFAERDFEKKESVETNFHHEWSIINDKK